MSLILDDLNSEGTWIPDPITFTYNTTETGHSLALDLYLPNAKTIIKQGGKSELAEDTDRGRLAIPIMVYFHGGGLMYGSRGHIPREFLTEVLEEGWAFISASHRFLFPCTGHDIYQDVRALFEYIVASNNGINGKLPPDLPYTLSLANIFVSGYSAGAYLARLACLLPPDQPHRPRPLAAFLLAGQGGNWLSPHYICPKAMGLKTRFERYKAWLYLDVRATSSPKKRKLIREKQGVQSDLGNTKFDRNVSSPEVMKDLRETNERMMISTVLYQIGRKLDYLTGHEGLSALLLEKHFMPRTGQDGATALVDMESTVPSELHYLFPEIILRDSVTAANHPPVIFIHGTGDKTVLPAESQLTARQLQDAGVEVELLMIQGWGHGYMPNIWEKWGKGRVIPFLKKGIPIVK